MIVSLLSSTAHLTSAYIIIVLNMFYNKLWSPNMMFSPCCRLVQTMDYSVVVFDTAPTGHTLRLLQFPATLEKGLKKMMELKNRFGGLLDQVFFIHFRLLENCSFLNVVRACLSVVF
jgi:hypothetical protein